MTLHHNTRDTHRGVADAAPDTPRSALRSPGGLNRRAFVALPLVSVAAGALARADAPASAPPEPFAFLVAQASAWNAGDLVAFCAAYADDAVFVSPSGVTRGRTEVLARYQKRYPTHQAMGTLGFEKIDVRHTAGMAAVAMRWILTYPDKAPSSGHTVVVLAQRGPTWCIVQDASM